MTTPPKAILSEGQIATLAAVGEERTAAVGDVLFRVGDLRYPFIAIVEGEAAILDGPGNEIIRHGPSGFLGEINLLSGQTVYLTAIVTKPMRYIAVDRDDLRPLLFDDAPLAELLLSTFTARREALQRWEGIGIDVIGPALLGGDAADRRVRPAQPSSVHLARPGALRRLLGGRAARVTRSGRAAACGSARRHGVARPLDR